MASVSQINFLQALGWALLNSLWQMALLWVIYKLLLSFFTQLKPGNKASLATLLIISGFGWFLFTFFTSFFFNSTVDFYKQWSGLIRENTWNLFIEKLLAWGSVIYLFILVIPVWKFIRNYRYVQTIRNKGLSKINAEWRIFVNNMATNIGIARKVQIWLSELVQTPVTIGYLKPVILIPLAAINHLTTQQTEAIILHELSHIRRYDYLFNLVIKFIKTILYFNPFVNLFIKNIERERENSCDEMVMQYEYRPEEYASALLLLEKNYYLQMMMVATGKDHDLLHRIESILGIRKKTNLSPRQISFSLIALLTIAFINILFSVNPNKEINSYLAINSDVNPFYFFNSRQSQVKKNPVTVAITGKRNQSTAFFPDNTTVNPPDEKEFIEAAAMPGFYNADFTTPVVPELAKEDELKLKETIGATQKILEENEWKEIENSYADVFNSMEKEKLKNEYQKEVSKIDWNKLETQLRLTYETINWHKVNDQVNASLARIKTDSIQQQIKLALGSLTHLENWMKENNTSSIPDTDISLEHILDYQQKAKAQLDKIKAIRNKKTVRL
jgi:beta-lactamase regulating signal transducer with metallopeptidase domain